MVSVSQASAGSKSFWSADSAMLPYRTVSSFSVGTWPNWMKSKGQLSKNEGSVRKGEPRARPFSECLSLQVNNTEGWSSERWSETAVAYNAFLDLLKGSCHLRIVNDNRNRNVAATESDHRCLIASESRACGRTLNR
jgi:hypothetical protein